LGRPQILHAIHNLVTLDNFAEDNVFAVEVWCGRGRDEELRAIGVGPTIGHRQEVLLGV